MVLVDATVWIDYLADRSTPETDWLDSSVTRRRLGLIDLTLCEILQGIRDDVKFHEVRRAMAQFAILDSGGEQLAVATAQNYRTLRSRGHTVRKTIDCIIATYCIREGHSLLHHDRDFDPFEEHLGLRVVHPHR